MPGYGWLALAMSRQPALFGSTPGHLRREFCIVYEKQGLTDFQVCSGIFFEYGLGTSPSANPTAPSQKTRFGNGVDWIEVGIISIVFLGDEI